MRGVERADRLCFSACVPWQIGRRGKYELTSEPVANLLREAFAQGCEN